MTFILFVRYFNLKFLFIYFQNPIYYYLLSRFSGVKSLIRLEPFNHWYLYFLGKGEIEKNP